MLLSVVVTQQHQKDADNSEPAERREVPPANRKQRCYILGVFQW